MKTREAKPVIPQFVADWIERQMKFGYEDVFISMTRLRERAPEKVKFWFDNNPDIYALAWLNGYEVAKEKLYHVKDNDETMLCKVYGKVMTAGKGWCIGYGQEVYHLTEKEIRDYDERYMAFAEEIL